MVSVKSGAYKGDAAVIVDILDQFRYLVEGVNVPRIVLNSRDVELTKIVVNNITRGISSADLQQAIKDQKVVEQYQSTAQFRRATKVTKRANLTDFDRFIVKKLKQQKKQLILKAYAPIKAEFDKVRGEEQKKVADVKKQQERDLKKKLTRQFRHVQKKHLKKAKAAQATTQQTA